MDGESAEVWFVSRGRFFRFVYPVHWKGYALQLGSLAVLLVWFGIAIKLGIMANRTWLFALGAGLIGVAVMYVTAQHTVRDS
jgi:hypothetical protein